MERSYFKVINLLDQTADGSIVLRSRAQELSGGILNCRESRPHLFPSLYLYFIERHFQQVRQHTAERQVANE